MAQEIVFPGNDPYAHVFQRRNAIIIHERDTHIPSRYVPHEHPESVPVKQDGVPLVPGFTVAEVPPERRYAIGPDGNLLSQREFEEQYKLNYVEWYEIQTPPVKCPDNPERIAVPLVARFVSVRVDPENASRFLPMHFDPDKPAASRPDQFFDPKNERFVPRMPALLEAYEKCPENLTPGERAEVTEYIANLKAHTAEVPVESPQDQATPSLDSVLAMLEKLDDPRAKDAQRALKTPLYEDPIVKYAADGKSLIYVCPTCDKEYDHQNRLNGHRRFCKGRPSDDG